MVCLAGIDVGTTGTKVTIYDENGKKLDSGYSEYSLSYPNPYWVEIDPAIWWKAVCDSFQEIFRRKLVLPVDIKGIGVSSTNALVLLSNDGTTVRPAIMQLDQRAADLIERIHCDIGEEYISTITKNRLASGAYWGPVLLWLKLKRVQELKRTSRFLTPQSFINYKLTNEYTIDHSRANTTMLYAAEQGVWDPKLCSYFGVNIELLPPIFHPGQITGTITSEAALKTGLLTGTPVITGCMDSMAGHIGIGATGQSASLILGSVGRICFNTKQCDERFMNVRNSIQSSMFSMTPTNGTGISYKWIKNLLFDPATIDPATIYQKMDKLAGESPVGAKGLIYHPYLSGERSPIWDPKASGSFFGLKTVHKREDIIRSVLEGVGYSLAHNYKIIKEEMGLEFDYFHASGGGAKSDTWLQLLADILGVPIKTPVITDSETLGIAIITGATIGVYSTIDEGIQAAVKFKEKYVPDKKNNKKYQDYLKAYIQIYENNKNLYKQFSELLN
jgi:xylulokinase